MDRLSQYAAREAEPRTEDERAKAEEEATIKLFERLKVTKAAKDKDTVEGSEEVAKTETENVNGTAETPAETPPQTEVTPNANGDQKSDIGEDVKLFEVFHEQVINLANTQRLPIQDVTALLVSLATLALYTTKCPRDRVR